MRAHRGGTPTAQRAPQSSSKMHQQQTARARLGGTLLQQLPDALHVALSGGENEGGPTSGQAGSSKSGETTPKPELILLSA